MLLEQSNCMGLGLMIRCYSFLWGLAPPIPILYSIRPVSIYRDRDPKKGIFSKKLKKEKLKKPNPGMQSPDLLKLRILG
jgi:hypothetical protein